MLLFQTIYKSRIFLRTQESPVIKQEDYHGRYESNYAAAQYAGTDDENAKWLNSQKPFLANILIRTVDDFKGMQPEEVVKLIEGEPSVGRTPVEEGFTNERLEDETMAISGMNTEKKVHNEGVTYFDVLFYVRTQMNWQRLL